VFLTALTEIPPDNGSPGYVTAAVVASAVLVLVYLLIVGFRVRDSARRLEELESRLSSVDERAAARPVVTEDRSAVGDPAAVAAAAKSSRSDR
jgi:hypothetical protein